MNRKKIGKILEKYIYLPLIAVLLTIIAQQYFFASNEKVKQKIELKKELLKEQLSSLRKMNRMIELGENDILFDFRQVYLDENGNVIGEDQEGIEMRIHEIATNKRIQEEWLRLKEEVITQKEVINPEVYKVFESLIQLVEENPFPNEKSNTDGFEISKVVGYEKSKWTNVEFKGRWISLNDYLKIKIEKVMNLDN